MELVYLSLMMEENNTALADKTLGLFNKASDLAPKLAAA
jgi:hypothetical protein